MPRSLRESRTDGAPVWPKLQLAILVLLWGYATAARAVEPQDAAQPDLAGSVPQPLDYRLIVAGQQYLPPRSQVYERGGVLLLPLDVVVDVLGGDYGYDDAENRMRVRRGADGALIEFDLDDGVVTANGRAVGIAPGFEQAVGASYLLPAPAVEALTGTNFARDDRNKTLTLTLDPRLQAVRGFDIVIDGRVLPFVEPEPRAIGPVLLLPLEPIVSELESRLEVDAAAQRVSVVRSQDNARITLDLASGVVTVDGRPVGVAPDMSFADTELLLLPGAAIEALTGTRVSISPGGQEVRINTDRRLRGLLKPEATVGDQIRATPFVAEGLDFHLGEEITNRVVFTSRWKQFNNALEYHTPGLLRPNAAIPSWLQLRLNSLMGPEYTLGSYNSSEREVGAVGVSSLAGVVYGRRDGRQRQRLVLGKPQFGSRRVHGDRNIPAYDGWVAGARHYDDGRQRELALAAELSEGEDAGQLVAEYEQRWRGVQHRLAQGSHFVRADLGAFDLPGTGGGFDVSGDFNSSYRFAPGFNLRTQFGYDGVNFNRGFRGNAEQNNREATDAADARVNLSRLWGWGVTTGVSAQYNRRDLLAGNSDQRLSARTYGTNLSLPLPLEGMRAAFDYTWSAADARGSPSSERRRGLGDLSWRHRYFDFQFRHEDERGDFRQWRSNANLSTRSLSLDLPRRARLQGAVGVSLVDSRGGSLNGTGTFRGGFRSGRLFGRKLDVAATYTRTDNVVTSDDAASTTADFLSLAVDYRLTRRLVAEMDYTTSFEGDSRVLFALRGVLDFNPPRGYTRVEDTTGILRGEVFLDANYDGVRQPQEDALPNVLIRIKGTALALRTNRRGGFTIQNLRPGLYEVQPDFSDLPLGWRVAEGAGLSLRVDAGGISRTDIPVVVTGQVRGQVFSDANHNGVFDADETPIEGAELRFEPQDRTLFSGAFGQFAIDGLPPGDYRVRVVRIPGRDAPVTGAAVDLHLAPGERQLEKVTLGVAPPQDE